MRPSFFIFTSFFNRISSYILFIHMKTYFLIILIFILSCSENGWSNERRKSIENECLKNAEDDISDKSKLIEICSCVTGKFIENFSWSEYQKMLDLRITVENSPDLNSKLQIHISSVMKECHISL